MDSELKNILYNECSINSRKLKTGDLVVSTITGDVLEVLENNKNFIETKHTKTNEVSKHFHPYPCFHRWSIHNAQNGDMLATDKYVFIFNRIWFDKKLNKNIVKYHCAIDFTDDSEYEQIYKYPDSNIVFLTSDKFKIPSNREINYLQDYLESSGFKWNANTKKLEYLERVIYKPGDYIFDIQNKEKFMVVVYKKNGYILQSENGTRSWRYHKDVNSSICYIKCTESDKNDSNHQETEHNEHYVQEQQNVQKLDTNIHFKKGEWVVGRFADGSFKIIDIKGRTYKLMDIYGQIKEFDQIEVNNELRFSRWTPQKAKTGDILHLDENNIEYLVMFEKYEGLYTKVSCRFNPSIEEIDYPLTVRSDSLRPAMHTETNMMFDAVIDESIAEILSNKKVPKAEKLITQPETKDEPDKFEISDWIIKNKNPNIKLCILEKENNKYCFCGGFSIRKSTIDKFYRKWTINDASDGDLLTIKTYKIFSGLLIENEWISKFNKIKDQSILTYLACEKNGASCIENMSFSANDEQVRPSTQEEKRIFEAKTRERYNTLIMETISNHLSEKPDIRFGQFIEEFLKSDASTNLNTEEPYSTYKNIKQFITKNKNKES